MEGRRRTRLGLEVAVAVTPGACLGGVGFILLSWAVGREQQDNERNWGMGVGTILLAVGLGLFAVSVVIMALYGLRESRGHRPDGEWG